MTSTKRDYFRYLSHPPEAASWGVVVTAAGFTRVPPRTTYPPARHPPDHHFAWSAGRVLSTLQVVLITAGRGWFESTPNRRRTITPGTAFLLMPGAWHRYKPDPKTGWEESWVELQGPVIDKLKAIGVLDRDSIVRKNALLVGMDAALDAIHERARPLTARTDPEMSAAALKVLALWDRAQRQNPLSRGQRSIAEAEKYLADHYAEPIDLSRLSRRLGMAYSYFRRTFRSHTGFAPWQYVLHLRLTHARRQLAAGDESVENMAARFGFSSAFHFSKAFKQAFGAAPSHWRRQLYSGKRLHRRA